MRCGTRDRDDYLLSQGQRGPVRVDCSSGWTNDEWEVRLAAGCKSRRRPIVCAGCIKGELWNAVEILQIRCAGGTAVGFLGWLQREVGVRL